MNKQWIRRIIVFVATVMVIIFVNSSGLFAEETPFHWNHINVDIDVQENGDMLITEEQEYEFTADYTNQRYRYIPLAKIGDITDVTVTENNQIIPSQTKIQDGKFWINWQHQLKAPEIHTFVLKYRVVDGLMVDPQTDTRVKWEAVFPNRTARVDKANVQVRLPLILAGKVTDFSALGMINKVRKIDSRTFDFTVNQAIQPSQYFAIQITFPSSILGLPGTKSSTSSRGYVDVPALISFFITLLIILLWFMTHGKD